MVSVESAILLSRFLLRYRFTLGLRCLPMDKLQILSPIRTAPLRTLPPADTTLTPYNPADSNARSLVPKYMVSTIHIACGKARKQSQGNGEYWAATLTYNHLSLWDRSQYSLYAEDTGRLWAKLKGAMAAPNPQRSV